MRPINDDTATGTKLICAHHNYYANKNAPGNICAHSNIKRTLLQKSRSTNERGVVAVYVAALMLVLLGVAALAIDVGYWYYEARREQQAVDQAALAGAVFLPDHPDLARATALESAGQNGFAGNVTATIGAVGEANQLRVTVSKHYPTFFGRVFGKKYQDVTRSGVAEYVAPLTIGSPFARLGNDPEDTSRPSENFWLNQHGPWVSKHNGDRYAADICDADAMVAHPTPYGCIASTQTRGNNGDYERIGQYGYRYSVNVTSAQAGKDLVFEVFDGVTANTGSTCYKNMPTSAEVTSLQAYVGDASTRYGTSPSWCAGDELNMGTATRSTQYMDTEFAVLSPSRSVAAGALVHNAVPAPAPVQHATTTLASAARGTIAGPCSPAAATGATTLNVTNDRATSFAVYWVNPTCVETLITPAPISPGATSTISTYAGQRYRIYDTSSKEFVSDYVVPTPASVISYARRSIESAAQPGSFVNAGSSNVVAEPRSTVVGSPLSATWEVLPAANGAAGCVTFKSAEATPRYLLYPGLLGAVTVNAAVPSPINATWCPIPVTTGSLATRFASAANPAAVLYVDAGTLAIGTTVAPPSAADAEFFLTTPIEPRIGEPFPTNGLQTLAFGPAGNQCLIGNGVTLNSPAIIDACSSSADSFVQVAAGTTPATVKLFASTAGLYIRPTASGTTPNTPLALEALATNLSDEYLPSMLPGGYVQFASAAAPTMVICPVGVLAGSAVAITAGCPHLATLRLGYGPVGAQIVPIPYSSAAPAATVSFTAHVNIPGPCPAGGATSDYTIRNSRSTNVDVYSLNSACNERYLGTVGALASTTFHGIALGQRIRVYEESTENLASDTAVTSPNQLFALPTSGQGTPCSTTGGASAIVRFENQRVAPIRVEEVNEACNFVRIQGIGYNNGWTSTTTAGTVFRIIDTYTGSVLRTYVTEPDRQTVTASDDLITSGACSPTSGPPITLEVVNERRTAMTVRRIDSNCTEVLFDTVDGGATLTIPTAFVGQRWKVYDGLRAVGDDVLDPSPATQQITISAATAEWVWDPNAGSSGGTQVCTRIETTYPLNSYNAADQHTGTVAQLINPVDGIHDNGSGARDTYSENFTQGFRRWRQICKIPAAEVVVGQYTITVKTNLNNESAGTNSFSLRAAWQGATPADRSDTGLNVSALENFPVFINIPGTSSTLYMTRINPVHAGKTLRLELFDIGDSSGSVSLRIVPPADSNVGSSWACNMKQVSSDGSFTPPQMNASTCSITGLTRAQYNGAAVQFDIPIPSNFTCNPAIATNCWTKVEITSTGTITDRTTWSATVLGDPLRLVS
jgi:hypothetical protein